MYCLTETELFICLLLGGGGGGREEKAPTSQALFLRCGRRRSPCTGGWSRPRRGCADKALRGAGGLQAGRARENERRRHLSLIFRCCALAICCMKRGAAVSRQGCRGGRVSWGERTEPLPIHQPPRSCCSVNEGTTGPVSRNYAK